jgi:hypothetical protein
MIFWYGHFRMRFLMETWVEKPFMVFEVVSAKSNNKDDVYRKDSGR